MTIQPPRAWLLHCPAGGGHRAAAGALAEHAMDAGWRAEVVDALSFTPAWFARSYVEMHLRSTHHAQWAYGYGYHRLDRQHPTLDRMRRRVDGLVGKRMLDAVRCANPDVIIATHFFPLSVLGRARRRGQLDIPLVGVVTDFAAHAFWVDPGVDAYAVASPNSALDLERHGVPPRAIDVTGIPVRGAFGDVPAPTFSAQRPPRILMTSGGFGIGPLEQAIRSFRGLPMPLTVVCGADAQRRTRVEAAAAAANVNADILGYVNDMPSRMRNADIIVGKPGGLTVSEALAAGRPMALMGTCPGQEAHNEEWLVIHGAAIALDPRSAGPQIAALHRSGLLPTMSRAAHHLGKPHAARDILHLAHATRRPNAA